ncbi:FAD-linked oxidase C-terminal domain-containing protein [Arthrobacter sp. zg-Y877]|uniref:FAD-binding oxidoreductase n=1 Tax=Arthrobacter sp. zg-Y877 TaxID=3049074 RepID=UPI0025A4BCFF|nr:FAD-linked oxidase C-terminal domain-containing protein [Arthrobacter sp. zg-Y877]MDM7990870.1 FAD-linked oxidase C-terminal domain-containing protein [Arthrobacter sp. zg-Y877]
MSLDALRGLSLSGADLQVDTAPEVLAAYAIDQGPVRAYAEPRAVVWPANVQAVQDVMRWATATGTAVVPRGAGTGVSGGAHATDGCIVLCLDRMNRILEINAQDEVAVVEPGVVNADLNAAAASHGLMYAPDPASYLTSTIGGNVATNAGGLRCAKYGVTRDSVLALDVVLADGTLISTGQRTFKGVAGYDLTGLFTGSEGTLGIIVGITVRLRYLPVEVRTIAAFFPDFPTAAAGVLAVGAARVQPAIMELLDGATLSALDETHGSNLRSRGNALLLIQTDGFGAGAEADMVRSVLTEHASAVTSEGSAEAVRLVDLRRHSRGDDDVNQSRVGEDVAVPRSALVRYVADLERMAARHRVNLKVVAHAGDGNLHPTFWVQAADKSGAVRLDAALDESISVALSSGGTITGEHGVGQFKLRWLPQEQQAEVMELQRRIKSVFDPAGILNPGKAIAGSG